MQQNKIKPSSCKNTRVGVCERPLVQGQSLASLPLVSAELTPFLVAPTWIVTRLVIHAGTLHCRRHRWWRRSYGHVPTQLPVVDLRIEMTLVLLKRKTYACDVAYLQVGCCSCCRCCLGFVSLVTTVSLFAVPVSSRALRCCGSGFRFVIVNNFNKRKN